MQKFTIFTIIFSLAIIFVMAELVINDYLESRTQGIFDLETSVIHLDDEKVEEKDEEKTAGNKNKKITGTAIDNELLQAVGIENAVLKEVNFNGSLFNLISLAGVENKDITKKNVFSEQEFKFTIYEIPLDDRESTQELYDFIKSAVSNVPNIAVNQTDNFGAGSFYVNDSQKKQMAFLLVKTANGLYGFEYTHPDHQLIKSIISRL